jgi:hypothetical protein
MTKQLNDQLKRESESLELWNSFEPVTVTDQRRKTFNVRSEMITRCKLNIQKYRETIAVASGRISACGSAAPSRLFSPFWSRTIK